MKKFISVLLVFVMVVGTLPMNVVAVASGNHEPKKIKDISVEMRLNDWYEMDLSEYFTDEDGDALTYFVSDDGVTWTKASESYNYYPAGDGEQKAYFKAADAVEESEIMVLTADVEEAPSEVTVTFSITKGTDRFYEADETGEIMFPVELTVPYFDLANYGRSDYYYNPRCYSTHKEGDSEYINGQLPGTKETAEGIVTVMHVFIYATEVLYLQYDKENAGKGLSYKSGDLAEAISWTGNAGSTFMKLWNHGTNLNYYVDWAYPLGAHKWGSTSDQIALYGGEDISAHMIEKSSATGSNYAFFTVDGSYKVSSQSDEVIVKQGERITLTAAQTQDNWESSITEYVPYINKDIVWTDAVKNYNGNLSDNSVWSNSAFGGNTSMKTDTKGQFIIDTTNVEPGEYYIAVMGEENRDNMTQTGPAVIRLIVKEAASKGDLNGDDIVNVTDVNMLINAYRGKIFHDAGDMNDDGKVDVTDVNLLINTYRNKS